MLSFTNFSPSILRAMSWPWNSSSSSSSSSSSKQETKKRKGDGQQQRSQNKPNTSSKLHRPLLSRAKDEGDVQGKPLWLPDAPLVPRPRASYNAASLAYLGDSIYELYVRCHFLSPPRSIDSYNTLVMGMVCCEAQDTLIKTLLKDDFLSEEERDIVRWGQNVQTNHKRATKRAGAAAYSRASSLETLIGYLYLTNPNRLHELMKRLGL